MSFITNERVRCGRGEGEEWPGWMCETCEQTVCTPGPAPDTCSNCDRIRQAMLALREAYVRLPDQRRGIEIALYEITDPLNFHGDLFDDVDEWQHPCMCWECRTSG